MAHRSHAPTSPSGSQLPDRPSVRDAVGRKSAPSTDGTVLHLEGVDAPVRTRVLGRTDHGVTVEQALPFLRLDSRVKEGRLRDARIRRVAVGFEAGVPRLIMELSYEGMHADVSLADFPPQQREAGRHHASTPRTQGPRRTDVTVPYEIHRRCGSGADTRTLAQATPGREPTRTLRLASCLEAAPHPDRGMAGRMRSVLTQTFKAIVSWLGQARLVLRRLRLRRA